MMDVLQFLLSHGSIYQFCCCLPIYLFACHHICILVLPPNTITLHQPVAFVLLWVFSK